MKMKPLYLSVAVLGMLSATAAYAKNVSTAEFVQKAAVANQFEIETSQIALDRTKNDDVKEFAQKMVDDHTDTAGKFNDALDNSKTKIRPPEELDAKHKAKVDKLDATSEASFDKQYIALQTDAHKQAVALFSNYAAHGTDPSLRTFAKDTLPALKMHLNHVNKLAAK